MSAPAGAWVTFEGPFDNAQDVCVFRSEIAALRHALDEQHRVIYVHWGESISDAVDRQDAS